MAPTEQWTRVILLVPPALEGRDLGASLQEQFAARNWFAIHVHDPYLALAELCLRERSQVSRAAWGLHRLEQISLVVLEPVEWNAAGVELQELTAAVKRFIPSASLWHIVDEQIVPVQQEETDHAVVRSMARQPAPANGSVATRTAPESATASSGHHPAINARQHALKSNAAASMAGTDKSIDDDCPTRLSRDEIEMLLDPLGSHQSEVAS